MSYLRNLGKSVAYAAPQTVRSKLDNLFNMGDQFKVESRDSIVNSLQDTKAIVRDDYASVVGTGFTNTMSALKSGKFIDPKRAEREFEQEMGFGDFDDLDSILGDDADFSSDDEDSGNSSSSKSATRGDAIVASTIAKSGSITSSKMDAVKDSVVASAEAGANLARHQLAHTAIGNQNANKFRSAMLDRLDRDYQYKQNIEKPYYQASLERLFSINQYIAELSDKITHVIDGQKASVTATDAAGQLLAGRSAGESDFQNVFDSATGGFNVSGYISVLNRRLKNFAEDNEFIFSQAKNPLELASGMVMDGIIPKGFTDRLEKFNDYIGKLPAVMMRQMDAFGDRMVNEDGILDKVFGRAVKFFSVGQDGSNEIKLDAYAKDQSVAFDGYTHRSIVEVIPTLLGDILSEVSSIRTKVGGSRAEGIKAYDYESGLFRDTAAAKKQLEDKIDKDVLQNFRIATMEQGVDQSGQMNDLFKVMTRENMNLGKKSEVKGNIDSLIESLPKEQRERLKSGAEQFKTVMENIADPNQFLFDIQNSIIEGNSIRSDSYSDTITGKEGINRFLFNSDLINQMDKSAISANSLRTADERSASGKILKSEAQRKEEEKKNTGIAEDKSLADIQEAIERGKSIKADDFLDDTVGQGGLFSDDNGNTSLKTIYQAPFKIVGRTLDTTRNHINNFLFGDKDNNKKSIVERINDGFFGEEGLFRGVVDGFNESEIGNYIKDKFQNIKDIMLGTPENDSALERLKKKFGVLGASFQASLPIDKIKDTLIGTSHKLANFIGISDGDIESSGGLFNYLKTSFSEQATKLGTALFGEQGEDGTRSGGVFGSLHESIKNGLGSISANITTPLKTALVGDNGEGGILREFTTNISEKLVTPFKESFSNIFESTKESFTSNFITPAKNALFGGSEDSEGKGIFSRVGEKIETGISYITDKFNEKIFDPLGNYFTNPETGLLPRMNHYLFDENEGMFSTFTSYLFNDESGLFTKLNGKLFNGEDSYMGRFQNWLNDPENGIFTKLSEKISVGFDAAKEIFNSIAQDVNEKFIQPMKQEMMVVWDFTKDYFVNDIYGPFKDEVANMYDRSVQFLQAEVFEPLKGTLQPFVEEAKLQWQTMKTQFGEVFKSAGKQMGESINEVFLEGFGKSFTDLMRDNVLDPIKETLSSVKEFLITSLSSLIKFPVNIIRSSSSLLKDRHARMGLDYVSGAMESSALDTISGISAGGDDQGTDNYLSRRVKEAQDRLGKVSDKAKESFMEAGEHASNAVSSAGALVKEQTENITDFASASFSPLSDVQSKANDIEEQNKRKVASNRFTGITDESSSNDSSDSIAEKLKEVMDGFRGSAKSSGKPATLGSITDSTTESASFAKKTHEFLTKNLKNVGNNLERIANGLGFDSGFENERSGKEGLMSKMKNFFKSPLEYTKNMMSGLSDKLSNGIKNVMTAPAELLKKATKGITETLKTGGKVIKGVTNTIKGVAETMGNVLSSIGSLMKPVLSAMKETIGMVSGMIADAGVKLAKGAAQVGGIILKEAGSLAKGFAKGAAEVGKKVFEAGGTVISSLFNIAKEITKVGTEVAVGIARTAGNLVGSTVGALFGGRKKKNYAEEMGSLTPVYVVGGYLAGTEGGVESLDEAKVGFNARGKFRSMADSIKESKLFETTNEYREKLLKRFGSLGDNMEGIKDGFKKFGMMILGGLGSLLSSFTGIGSALLNGLGFPNAAKMIGKLGGGQQAPIATDRDNNRRNSRRTRGGRGMGMRGMGIAAVGGLAGQGINMLADGMEEGVAKEATHTAGTAMSWGATGAMIGSVIPGVGTAIGGAVGAIGGAVYENWDHITNFVKGIPEMWDNFKAKLSEMWVSVKNLASDAWEGIKKLPGKLWEGYKNLWKGVFNFVGDVASKAWNGITNLASNTWDGIKNKATEMWDSTKTFMSDTWEGIKSIPSNIIEVMSMSSEEAWNSIKDKAFGVWDSVTSKFKSAINSLPFIGDDDDDEESKPTVSSGTNGRPAGGQVTGPIDLHDTSTGSIQREAAQMQYDVAQEQKKNIEAERENITRKDKVVKTEEENAKKEGLLSKLRSAFSGITSSIGSGFSNVKDSVSDTVSSMGSGGSTGEIVGTNAGDLKARSRNMMTPSREGQVADFTIDTNNNLPVREAAELELLKFNKPSLSLNGLEPNMKQRFLAMAKAYREKTGNTIQVNSAFRSFDEQEKLYKTMAPGKAARPGASMHNYGYAIDIQSAHANELNKLGLLQQFGFHRPVSSEAWHVEDGTVDRAAVRQQGMQMYAKGEKPQRPDAGQLEGESETETMLASQDGLNGINMTDPLSDLMNLGSAASSQRSMYGVSPQQAASAPSNNSNSTPNINIDNGDVVAAINSLKELVAAKLGSSPDTSTRKPAANTPDVNEFDLLASINDQISKLVQISSGKSDKQVANNSSTNVQRVSRANSANLFNISGNSRRLARES